ncbi:hypothetical protein SPRG_03231, partial [Saprolegnia parasitica CBS 223.65]
MNKARRKLREPRVENAKAGPVSMHLSIPLRPQERPTAFPDDFYHVVLKEYATKYLEQLGANPTADNLALVLANVPLDKCRVAPGWRSRGCIDDVLVIDTSPVAVRAASPELAPLSKPETLPADDPVSVFGTDLAKNYRVGHVVLSFHEMKHRYLFPFNQLYKVPIEYDQDGFPCTKRVTFSVVPERRVYKPSPAALAEIDTPLHSLTFETIAEMQEAFYNVIPFDMLDINDRTEHAVVRSFLTSSTTLELIGYFAHYVYWTAFRPLGDLCRSILRRTSTAAREDDEYERLPSTPFLSHNEVEGLLVSVLDAFEHLKRSVHERVRPKTTTRSTTPMLQLLLLSLRVSLATIFRLSYPRWFDDTALRVEPTLMLLDDVIDQIVDPNHYYSHIGALEATSDAINFTKTHAYKLQKRKTHLRTSFFATSRGLQALLPTPSSGGPRRILSQGGGTSVAHYTTVPDTGASGLPMSLVHRMKLLRLQTQRPS